MTDRFSIEPVRDTAPFTFMGKEYTIAQWGYEILLDLDPESPYARYLQEGVDRLTAYDTQLLAAVEVLDVGSIYDAIVKLYCNGLYEPHSAIVEHNAWVRREKLWSTRISIRS